MSPMSSAKIASATCTLVGRHLFRKLNSSPSSGAVNYNRVLGLSSGKFGPVLGIGSVNGGSVAAFSMTAFRSGAFESAQDRLKTVKDVGNDKKLQIYALYKQATVGVNNTKKPGMMDMVGKAKWDAWNSLGNMSQDEAKKQYVALVDSLAGAQSSKAEAKVQEGPGITVTVKDGIRTILMNRPDKFNALTPEMYDAIASGLKEANTDDNTTIIVLTGAGKYFCSGNDLGNFANVTDVKAMAKSGRDRLHNYVSAYIDCKKPLIALVNGPAVGVSITVLGLCDSVYSTDKATFTCPFSALGQSPEACSSYTFPRIMGYAKASELLFFNQKITAGEAERLGLVSQVFPDASFQTEAWAKVKQFAELPVKSLVYSKDLVRGREREILHAVNTAESDRLEERWQSQDCANAIMKFFSRKSKV